MQTTRRSRSMEQICAYDGCEGIKCERKGRKKGAELHVNPSCLVYCGGNRDEKARLRYPWDEG